jgi:hypothetical protein
MEWWFSHGSTEWDDWIRHNVGLVVGDICRDYLSLFHKGEDRVRNAARQAFKNHVEREDDTQKRDSDSEVVGTDSDIYENKKDGTARLDASANLAIIDARLAASQYPPKVKQFLRALIETGRNVQMASERTGISRQIGHQWNDKYFKELVFPQGKEKN